MPAIEVREVHIEMPGAGGLEVLGRLVVQRPDCRILILTTFGRPGYLRRAMEGGAAGFLLKDAPIAQLSSAIRRAMAGERIVDPGLAAAALSEGPRGGPRATIARRSWPSSARTRGSRRCA